MFHWPWFVSLHTHSQLYCTSKENSFFASQSQHDIDIIIHKCDMCGGRLAARAASAGEQCFSGKGSAAHLVLLSFCVVFSLEQRHVSRFVPFPSRCLRCCRMGYHAPCILDTQRPIFIPVGQSRVHRPPECHCMQSIPVSTIEVTRATCARVGRQNACVYSCFQHSHEIPRRIVPMQSTFTQQC